MFNPISQYFKNKRTKENRNVLTAILEIKQNSCLSNCYPVVMIYHLRAKNNIWYSYSKIYRILDHLTELGYVSYTKEIGNVSRDNKPKRVYSIKDKGYIYLAKGDT